MEEGLHGDICGTATSYGEVEAATSRNHISGINLCPQMTSMDYQTTIQMEIVDKISVNSSWFQFWSDILLDRNL